ELEEVARPLEHVAQGRETETVLADAPLQLGQLVDVGFARGERPEDFRGDAPRIAARGRETSADRVPLGPYQQASSAVGGKVILRRSQEAASDSAPAVAGPDTELDLPSVELVVPPAKDSTS